MNEAPDPADLARGTPSPAVGVRFLTRLDLDPAISTIGTIDGIGEAEAIPGVKSVHLDLRPGQEVPPLESSWGRFGAVIAVGETREDVVRVLDAACRTITIS